MAKQTLGQKQACPECGTKFYDFEAVELTCPKCSFEFTASAQAESFDQEDDNVIELRPERSGVVDSVEIEIDKSQLEAMGGIEELEAMDDYEDIEHLEEVEDHHEDAELDPNSDDADDGMFIDDAEPRESMLLLDNVDSVAEYDDDGGEYDEVDVM